MNIRTARRIASGLPLPEPVTRVEYLRKGYSQDRKYILWSGGEPRWLLRICPGAEADRRRQGFELLGRLYSHGVACPQPIHFGEDGDTCYFATSYLPGECVEDALAHLTEEEHCFLGVQAGRQLRLIQSALSPDEPVDWPAMRRARYDEHRATCREMGVDFEGRETSERYVERHLHLLEDRPITILHGDYHPGNMICRGAELTGVIDFDRYRWGDPLFEFYKVGLLTVPISPSFARGQVHGYFNGEPSSDFWPLYNLYLAMILPADIVWTSRSMPRALARSMEWIEEITRTHDFAAGGPPEWWGGGRQLADDGW